MSVRVSETRSPRTVAAMAPTLYVAAGGGGDAIAAWALRPLAGDRPVIATFAWDRIMVDPLPGPRTPRDFDNLEFVDSLNYAFAPSTQPIPPAGSTMPQLASQVEASVVLLDPTGGAAGLRAQLRSLARTTSAERIQLVDVGGDIAAAGDESTLRSPLADALVLAAADGQDVPVEVVVIGAGLDGELPAATVRAYVLALGGRQVNRLSAERARDILPILEWHPTEATALTAAAALGRRGTVEIREQGHVVELTDDSPNAYAIDHGSMLGHSRPAQAVHESCSIDDADNAVRTVCGRSELDRERRKSHIRRTAAAPRPTNELLAEALAYCEHARTRGIDYVTFRRLAEVLGLNVSNADELRRKLIAGNSEHYQAPLWSVSTPHSSPGK